MSNTVNAILFLHNYLIFISFFFVPIFPQTFTELRSMSYRDKAIADLLFTRFLPKGLLSSCWCLHWLQSRPVADMLSGDSDCYHQFKMFTHSMYVDYCAICYKLEIQQETRKKVFYYILGREGCCTARHLNKQIKYWQVLVSAVEKVSISIDGIGLLGKAIFLYQLSQFALASQFQN